MVVAPHGIRCHRASRRIQNLSTKTPKARCKKGFSTAGAAVEGVTEARFALKSRGNHEVLSTTLFSCQSQNFFLASAMGPHICWGSSAKLSEILDSEGSVRVRIPSWHVEPEQYFMAKRAYGAGISRFGGERSLFRGAAVSNDAGIPRPVLPSDRFGPSRASRVPLFGGNWAFYDVLAGSTESQKGLEQREIACRVGQWQLEVTSSI